MGSPMGVEGIVILLFFWLWLTKGGCGLRTQQMEPEGVLGGVGLGWVLNSTWLLFLSLPPNVGISPPIIISRFLLGQGWFGNTSSVVEGTFVMGS